MENINTILKKFDILTKKWMTTVDYSNGGYYQLTPELRKIEIDLSELKDSFSLLINFSSKKEKFNYFTKLKKIIDKNNILNLSDNELSNLFWWEYKTFKNRPGDYKPTGGSTNITIEDIVNSLEKFDWSYEMSDDNRIWTRGKAKREEIGKKIDEFLDAYPNQKAKLFSVLKKVFNKDGRKHFFDPSDFSSELRGL